MASFCWMCLEGIHLYRIVILFLNNFKTLDMMAGGFGVPVVAVTISVLANPDGYGTERYCWLNLKYTWSFFGPACFIIIINISVYLFTVWKLTQKFSNLSTNLENLDRIQEFSSTAVSQLFVLGNTWIFGCFALESEPKAMSFLIIFGTLQGVMLFMLHCLFSKQVREEYKKLYKFCVVQKKSQRNVCYSISTKTHGTEESQI
ncbi:adhesion G protein-coupled receptor E5-like [Pholidichthys leucotaenia]